MKPSANWEQGQASSELGSPPRSGALKPVPAWEQQKRADQKGRLGMRLVGTFNAKLQYFGFSGQLWGGTRPQRPRFS